MALIAENEAVNAYVAVLAWLSGDRDRAGRAAERFGAFVTGRDIHLFSDLLFDLTSRFGIRPDDKGMILKEMLTAFADRSEAFVPLAFSDQNFQ
jgi:hypothetical protein